MAGLTGLKTLECELCRAAGDCQYRGQILAAVGKTREEFGKAHEEFQTEQKEPPKTAGPAAKEKARFTNTDRYYAASIRLASAAMKPDVNAAIHEAAVKDMYEATVRVTGARVPKLPAPASTPKQNSRVLKMSAAKKMGSLSNARAEMR